MKTTTIDINCKEWFDKANGNSYFAGSVTVNYALKDEKSFIIPFQYGYSAQYIYESLNTLKTNNIIDTVNIQELKSQNIIIRQNLQTGCKKRDLK